MGLTTNSGVENSNMALHMKIRDVGIMRESIYMIVLQKEQEL